MPKRKDIKKILVVGAGPIIIGQACEFDYSGTQACKALKDEGYKVILINSNPATIMTDPDVADKTYIEPITLQVLEKIIIKEKPDAILPTMGGQTALNLAMEAEKNGIFLSNGPGDPAATGKYAIPIIKEFIKNKLPIFGICLGHQLLGLALGAKTKKMSLGHRGANHPVKNMIKGNVEITSQNHGFEIVKQSLPRNIQITHQSLFDKSIEGIKLKSKPVFSVQYHPESNPGPQDSVYLFEQFIMSMKKNAKKKRY